MSRALGLLVVVLLTGCCQREIVTRTDTTTVYIPYDVRDTLTLYRMDSMWFAQDTVIHIRIDTLMKKLYYRIVDTLVYTRIHTDSVEVIKNVIVEYSFWDKVRLVLLTLGIVSIVYVVLMFIRR